jgi:hypothetical protein
MGSRTRETRGQFLLTGVYTNYVPGCRAAISPFSSIGVDFSLGGQTPYRCHSRNHGLWAYISSCLRFAAERSLNWSGRVSGRAKMCSSHSISAIACSASILLQYLPEVRRRRKAALARSLSRCPTAWATAYTRYQSDPHALVTGAGMELPYMSIPARSVADCL